MEVGMAVWVLEPIDISNDTWIGSDPIARIVVVADIENDARKAAAENQLKTFTKTSPHHDEGTPPSERNTVSPWRDRSASSCTRAEIFADPIIAIELLGTR